MTLMRPAASFILVLCCLLSGCLATNPVSGKREFSLVDGQQELAIGSKYYGPSQQQQGGRYIIDPALEQYVAKIGHKLASLSHRPELPYEFVVLNNSVPNAWALPGGKIAINRGLLLAMKDEAQLASVLAHEIVHAAARHGAAQQTRGQLLGIGLQVLDIGLRRQQIAGGGYIMQGAQLSAMAFNARYGRDAELESDRIGIDYMAKAGYDLDAAVELQQTFVQLAEKAGHNSNWLNGLFASHPPSRERVERNRQRAASQGIYRGIRNQSAFEQAIGQIKRDEQAYKDFDNALKELRISLKNDQQTSLAEPLALVEKAIDQQDKEARFWILKGDIFMEQGRYQSARQAFNKAIELNPGYFESHLSRGMLNVEQGRKAAAIVDLERSQELLPTQVAADALAKLLTH